VLSGVLLSILVLLIALPVVSWWWIIARQWREWWEEKRPALAAAAHTAQPLIDALEAYRRDQGRYPDELEALVPGCLDAIPQPPTPIRYGWEYVALERGREFMLWGEPGQNYSGVMPMPPTNAEFLLYESDGTYTLHLLNAESS